MYLHKNLLGVVLILWRVTHPNSSHAIDYILLNGDAIQYKYLMSIRLQYLYNYNNIVGLMIT